MIVDFGAQASAAATSATAAAASETAAASSATAAASSATSASGNATAAGNSATAASGSATTSTEQATASSDSATAAAGSATAASGSATAAATSETNAAASAASITFATQAEAEAGTISTKVMSPLRTAEAIAALAAASSASASDRTALKALNTSSTSFAFLTEAGREGSFAFRSGDYSTHVALDTNEGVYVKATAIAAASGAWVRQFNFIGYQSKWFGAVADYATDNTSVISSAIAVANLPNTSSATGKQRAAFINVDGGVKFASQNLNWLPAEDWIFVFINYFANSDTTKGVATGGGGTNERLTLSVNSGFPGDATGALVAEDMFTAPLHPGSGVNVKKNADSSIVSHIGAGQEVQPTATQPVRGSVATIQDENFERFRIMYQNHGKIDSYNGVFVYVGNRKTFLAFSGANGSGAWGSNVPVVGDVVRGIDTNSRYVVTSLATTNALDTNWLSGEAVPGDTLMRERAIFKGSISGLVLTVTALDQGSISDGATIVGMLANSGVAAGTTIDHQSSGTPGGVGVYVVTVSQTVEFTQLVSGNVSANPIEGFGVTNTDTHATPLAFDLYGGMYFSAPFYFMRTRTSYVAAGNAAQSATMTNGPVAGNPTKWVAVDDNGTRRYIPMW